MKITADTNVLVRALTEDHAEQSKAAQLALRKADVVALTIPTLCELVWVLQGYKIRSSDIAETVLHCIMPSTPATCGHVSQNRG